MLRICEQVIEVKGALFVSVSHQTGLETRSMTWRSIIVGIKAEESQARAEAWALIDYAGHRPTYCNVGPIDKLDMDPNLDLGTYAWL